MLVLSIAITSAISSTDLVHVALKDERIKGCWFWMMSLLGVCSRVIFRRLSVYLRHTFALDFGHLMSFLGCISSDSFQGDSLQKESLQENSL